MANKPNPIIFKITDAGRLAVLDAQKQGLSLTLKTLVAGTSKYIPNGKETRIKTEAMRSDIVTSGIEKESKSLRFSVTLNSITSKDIYEIGLLTSDNKLFAIAASNTTPLFTVYANVSFVGSFGLSLSELNADNVKVVTDPSSAIAVKLMEDHLAANDPHPQYIRVEKLTQLDKKVDKLGQNIATASGDLSKHIAAANPHPQYALKKDSDDKTQKLDALTEGLRKDLDAQKGTLTQQGGTLTQQGKDIAKVTNDLANHIKAADPHTQYAKKTDLTAHTSAAHPHSQYLRESDLAGMKKQIEQLQQQLVAAQNKVTELPVGSIYTTTNNYKSSAEVKAALGYGTWARFAEGQTLVGISTKAADPAWTKTLKSSYGAYEHKLVAEEMPSTALKVREAGRHSVRNHGAGGTNYASGGAGKMIPLPSSETGWKDKPHNNVQPSIVVAYWIRTA